MAKDQGLPTRIVTNPPLPEVYSKALDAIATAFRLVPQKRKSSARQVIWVAVEETTRRVAPRSVADDPHMSHSEKVRQSRSAKYFEESIIFGRSWKGKYTVDYHKSERYYAVRATGGVLKHLSEDETLTQLCYILDRRIRNPEAIVSIIAGANDIASEACFAAVFNGPAYPERTSPMSRSARERLSVVALALLDTQVQLKDHVVAAAVSSIDYTDPDLADIGTKYLKDSRPSVQEAAKEFVSNVQRCKEHYYNSSYC